MNEVYTQSYIIIIYDAFIVNSIALITPKVVKIMVPIFLGCINVGYVRGV